MTNKAPAKPVPSRDEVLRQANLLCPKPPPPTPPTDEEIASGYVPDPRCPDISRYVNHDGLGASDQLPRVRGGQPLPDWNLNELLLYGCAYACAAEGSRASLLMWSIIEDDRPLRNHNAYVAVRDTSRSDGWVLVNMYRHATNIAWNVNTSFHYPRRPVRRFAAAPSDDEIADMLKTNRWLWGETRPGDPDPYEFEVLAGNVLDQVWQQTLQRPPQRRFVQSVEFWDD